MRQVVILAAGKGLRMLPLTKDIPKPLIEINGKPFIYYILKNLKEAEFEKVFLIVGYKQELLEEYFSKNDFGMEIELVSQIEQLGTGDAVKVLQNKIKEDFVVLMGDNLYSMNDLKAVKFNDKYSYAYGWRHPHPEKFGVLILENGFLSRIEEKPENPKSDLINSGMYKFTVEIFDALDKIEKSPRGEYELTSAISLLATKKKVKVKMLNDYWVDFGRFEDVPKVESFVKENF